MSQINYDELSFDDEDELKFPRPTKQGFDDVVERAVSRRGFSWWGCWRLGSGAAVMGYGIAVQHFLRKRNKHRVSLLTNLPHRPDGHRWHVPDGYDWDVLVALGDPLFSDAPAFDPATGIPTAGSDRVFGENTDGMETVSGR